MNALAIAKTWQQGDIMTENPVVGPDGAIEYLFGAEQPTVVCAVMQITDIELQRGENVTSVNLGDSVRWQVQPALSGGDVTHILVRPKQVGLETSMVVTTDKRTYHFRLRSHRSEYMPRVKFFYIEDALNKWTLIKTEAAAKRDAATLPETNEYLGDLDFNNQVTGRASWKPVRVYNDGTKTILEMPDSIRQKEAPTLLVVRRGGRLLKKSDQVLVNYASRTGATSWTPCLTRLCLSSAWAAIRKRSSLPGRRKGGNNHAYPCFCGFVYRPCVVRCGGMWPEYGGVREFRQG